MAILLPAIKSGKLYKKSYEKKELICSSFFLYFFTLLNFMLGITGKSFLDFVFSLYLELFVSFLGNVRVLLKFWKKRSNPTLDYFSNFSYQFKSTSDMLLSNLNHFISGLFNHRPDLFLAYLFFQRNKCFFLLKIYFCSSTI